MFHHVAFLVLLVVVQGCSTTAMPRAEVRGDSAAAAPPREGASWVEGASAAPAVVAVDPLAAQAEDPIAARARDEAPLFPLPFTPDFTRGGGWGVALGAGVEYENAYTGSDEYEFE